MVFVHNYPRAQINLILPIYLHHTPITHLVQTKSGYTNTPLTICSIFLISHERNARHHTFAHLPHISKHFPSPTGRCQNLETKITTYTRQDILQMYVLQKRCLHDTCVVNLLVRAIFPGRRYKVLKSQSSQGGM